MSSITTLSWFLFYKEQAWEIVRRILIVWIGNLSIMELYNLSKLELWINSLIWKSQKCNAILKNWYHRNRYSFQFLWKLCGVFYHEKSQIHINAETGFEPANSHGKQRSYDFTAEDSFVCNRTLHIVLIIYKSVNYMAAYRNRLLWALQNLRITFKLPKLS